MKLNLKLAQRFFLCAAPLVTGSVFVALPGNAATIAASESAFNLSNFSHNPVGTSTLTRTNTLAISTITEPDGSHELAEGESAEIIPLSVQVAATANALATFPVAPVPQLTEASNITYSLAQGDAEGTGNNYSYLGVAESAAQIVGYNFNVGAGEKFSFDFVSLVSLYTSRDNVISETTNAFSNISFALFDAENIENPLDFFSFSAQLDSPSAKSNSPAQNFLGFAANQYSNIEVDKVAFKASTGDKQQSLFGFVQGTFSRYFEKVTSLILVGFNSNGASVSCHAPWK